MSKDTGEWLPYNLNNGPHDCRNPNASGSKQKEEKQQEARKFTLEEVVRKLESVGVIINVERLMKE